ncbi:hypothetical protein FKR81_16480 [Lentzea tibetensis]|uniref:Proline-rich protein n=1 Tax=Lentzea tibetensis TaxID=2591470 RepID=A0A563EUN7_9PSEU|nr:hypothetical protein [Lentzea tibetensis]TWP51211.1 hypothetical protein FKR81_16480 [Lentzea tibetensis]
MNTQQSRLGAEHYLAGMRAALADLPASEVAEIMEDVEAHVTEVAAELGEDETLEQRLGTPEAYAQELRTAAGYPARTEVIAKPNKLPALSKPRIAAWLLGGATAFTLIAGTALLREAGVLLLPAAALAISYVLVREHGPEQRPMMQLPEVLKLGELLNQPAETPAGRAIAYLRSLQPAWWLLRTVLLVVAAVLLTSRDLFAFLIIAALAALAFYAGPKSKTDRRWLWITLPASALAAATILQMIDVAADSMNYGRASNSYPVQVTEQYENIYPFDSNGKLLEGVLLFDQDGNAINAQRDYPCPGTEPMIPNNKYPRPKIDRSTGECLTIPPSAAVPPSASSPPSVSGTPSSAPPTSGSSAPSSPPASASPSPSK